MGVGDYNLSKDGLESQSAVVLGVLNIIKAVLLTYLSDRHLLKHQQGKTLIRPLQRFSIHLEKDAHLLSTEVLLCKTKSNLQHAFADCSHSRWWS